MEIHNPDNTHVQEHHNNIERIQVFWLTAVVIKVSFCIHTNIFANSDAGK